MRDAMKDIEIGFRCLFEPPERQFRITRKTAAEQPWKGIVIDHRPCLFDFEAVILSIGHSLMKPPRRHISELDAKIPRLHGAITRNATFSGPLAELFHSMLRHEAATAQEYRTALDAEITSARQALIRQLGTNGQDHHPDLVAFDQTAEKMRQDTEAALSQTTRETA